MSMWNFSFLFLINVQKSIKSCFHFVIIRYWVTSNDTFKGKGTQVILEREEMLVAVPQWHPKKNISYMQSLVHLSSCRYSILRTGWKAMELTPHQTIPKTEITLHSHNVYFGIFWCWNMKPFTIWTHKAITWECQAKRIIYTFWLHLVETKRK